MQHWVQVRRLNGQPTFLDQTRIVVIDALPKGCRIFIDAGSDILHVDVLESFETIKERIRD